MSEKPSIFNLSLYSSLTNDLEAVVERDKTTVQCLPVAKFLLLPDVLNR